MTNPRPLVAGNWKMNGLRSSSAESERLSGLLAEHTGLNADVMLCTPATLISQFADQLSSSGVMVGGQDCHPQMSGAHTGDIAAEMLADAGATAVIVGHSERRADHGETNELVRAKAEAAHRAGLIAIVCIGETEDERKGGKTLDVVGDQLAGSLPEGATSANTVIAYEPVWAIGTGLTPTTDDVAAVHTHIRSQLNQALGEEQGTQVRILYGGSVKPANAAELMGVANVNGALVGGASLKADDFWQIACVYLDA
ncbi:MAG: triose-phosphate isomerase [Pseudomonadota bacterium]